MLNIASHLTLFIVITLASIASAKPANTTPSSFTHKMAAIEANAGTHLGVSVMNMANHQQLEYRANERFAIQSTFKLLVVAAVLKASETTKGLLDKKIDYQKSDLVFWSPITKKHLAQGMTFRELCAAALAYSDNTATNQLLKYLGGPRVVTEFARKIGDASFTVSHYEALLNSNPSDTHDTSTPKAMRQTLQTLAFGNVLNKKNQSQLLAWMKANTTGDTRIRKGVPNTWIVADKTGAGQFYGVSNDIAILWPPKHAPILIAIYLRKNQKKAHRNDAVLVKATQLVLKVLAKKDLVLNRV